ncbi:Predicted ATP-dependent endonuclease of the OLD family, contains P-loop ATPase and TOPRIM domains [Halanaerobium kushneri]|uniref:Predicted ATP-dependent endonuclease of the OLD family, contains P-loop ATPase and TOPRIM domains n=1 Tax=Halanaerobium kushneri TaxID=56779 RepID=A0A1N6RRE2_9FIRM|nr:Predicted ATP-dependent endonuclease of the OLD family, contains P-loop ATPase and TOPRIM domains [Halanaerobium kushneri]
MKCKYNSNSIRKFLSNIEGDLLPISRIKIKNCISLKDIEINLKNSNCLLGENGTGKSNLLKTIYYYYKKLTDEKVDFTIRDKENSYNQYSEIKVTYDLSNFKNILLNNFFRNEFSYSHSYLNKISKFINQNATDNKITVVMKKYKKEYPTWNYSYEERKMLQKLFPVYFLHCKNINEKKWMELWSMINDLNKISMDSKNKINSTLETMLNEDEINKQFQFIREEFKKSNISVEEFNIKEVFNHLYQLYLGGRKFNIDDRELDFSSEGITSYNYMTFFLSLAKRISDKKLKEPLLIFDEPELNLHPYYIDQLNYKMVDVCNEKLRLVLATHSPRVIKNIIRSEIDYNLYHFNFENKYSDMKRMKPILKNTKSYHKITVTEASFYFSKAIVFLEGVTERELFTNKNILELFPKLRKVNFYHNLSDYSAARVLSPRERGYKTPHLFLVDLDKILNYSYKNKRFSKSKSDKFVNPLTNVNIIKKEKFLYGKKRKEFLTLRNQIDNELNKDYNFDLKWGKGANNYLNLKNLIKDYCMRYNVIVAMNTLEDIIINQENISFFKGWALDYKNNLNIANKFQIDDLTLFRLLFSGKLSNLQTLDNKKKQIKKVYNQSNKSVLVDYYKKINELSVNKTEWITELMDYFFEENIDKEKTLYDKKTNFKNYFPELFYIIEKIESLLVR